MIHKSIHGGTAAEIAASVERAVRDGQLAPGATLPTVRGLAADLGVSPATVSSAYRTLKARGLLVTAGRRGTAIRARPPLPARPGVAVPARARDLANGNPDPRLLPSLASALRTVDPAPRLYGQALSDPRLLRLARRDLARDGVPAAYLTVVGGALDGIERVLQAHLRPGDRVAVEDPGFTGVLDLVAALGLQAVAVAVDDAGPLPDALDAALGAGAQAFVLTPRAQNPFGAALDAPRAKRLRAVLRDHRDVLLIEDDHAGPVAGAPALCLADATRPRFAHVRSVSKSLGPDLRLAVLAGDAQTVARVEGRHLLGMRWISHILQQLVVALWQDRAVARRVRDAARTYTVRRRALIEALAARGIRAHGRTGFNVWVPVAEEAPVLQALLGEGWAACGGERFRLASGPAVRITTASLRPEEAEGFAETLAKVLRPGGRTLSA